MKELIKGIFTKMSGSALSTSVGGRLFINPAPEGSEFPYVVVDVVTSSPEDAFSLDIEDTLVQFSIYSTDMSVVEIADIYELVKALFKDTRLTITGDTNVEFSQNNLVTMADDLTAPSGISFIRHWAVEYNVVVQD